MPQRPIVLEHHALEHTREMNMEHYVQQAAWHQHQALASLTSVQERGADTPEQRTDQLLAALHEALSGWHLLQHAQQEAPTRTAAAQVGRRLGQVSALAVDIEHELYEPAGAQPPG